MTSDCMNVASAGVKTLDLASYTQGSFDSAGLLLDVCRYVSQPHRFKLVVAYVTFKLKGPSSLGPAPPSYATFLVHNRADEMS